MSFRLGIHVPRPCQHVFPEYLRGSTQSGKIILKNMSNASQTAHNDAFFGKFEELKPMLYTTELQKEKK